MTDKHAHDTAQPSRPKSQSLSSHGKAPTSVGDGSRSEHRSRSREVRTLPSWIHSVGPADLEDPIVVPDPNDRDLLSAPTNAHVAFHPYALHGKHRPEPGRLHDASRERTPLVVGTPTAQHASRWRSFAMVSALPPEPGRGGRRVDEQWLIEHMPELDGPMGLRNGDGDAEKQRTIWSSKAKRQAWYTRVQRTLLRNPLVPVFLRLIIWTFSLVALALGASILTLSKERGFTQRASTLIAIVFDAVALIYLIYITYDEYSAKPLGLRSPKTKLRLVLLDLIFIVFNSANLSLAFDALLDPRFSCRENPNPERTALNDGTTDPALCRRQRALSAVLLVALIAWLSTFVVTTFRLVERVARD